MQDPPSHLSITLLGIEVRDLEIQAIGFSSSGYFCNSTAPSPYEDASAETTVSQFRSKSEDWTRDKNLLDLLECFKLRLTPHPVVISCSAILKRALFSQVSLV